MPNQFTYKNVEQYNSHLLERFWSKVEKTDTCWLWTGANTGRYGVIWIDGRQELAHRLSWTIHNCFIPVGKFVCHKCDVMLCVRPDHLFLGTPLDNMRDMHAKHRWHGVTFKINMNIAREIRNLRSNGMTAQAIGSIYNISRQAVTDICYNRTWKEGF